MGGLVGHMVADGTDVPNIVNSYATADMVGYTMGGIVGLMEAGSVTNSFAYPRFTSLAESGSTYYAGGLAANMAGGTMTNCYVHEQAGGNRANALFGWFAGNQTGGAFNYCYAPEDDNYVHDGTLAGTGYGWFAPTALASGKYGYAHRDQDVTAAAGQENNYIENGAIDNQGNLYGLVATLNKWVGTNTAYAQWTRTMASSINDDLPILRYSGYVAAGSPDGVFVEYTTVLDTIIKHFNKYTYGDIYVYEAPGEIKQGTVGNVRVYIPEHMCIMQDDGITVNARVGVTLDNSSTGFMSYDWHMLASPLSDAPMGIDYYPDPLGYGVEVGSGDITVNGQGYIPSGIDFGNFDFYTYYEPQYHWINFKRRGDDHWHTDGGANIGYQYWNGTGFTSGNEPAMVPGKGYLMALGAPTMVMADGVLNNQDVTVRASAEADDYYGYQLRGVNLVGNPYQSYLNVADFLTDNNLTTCYILDADAGGYIAYTVSQTIPDQSLWPYTLQNFEASQYLHPHQGFFVCVDQTTSLTFDRDKQLTAVPDGNDAHFRGEAPQYPLVSISCTDGNGRNDFATVELDRPEQGGGEKILGLHAGDASVWFHFDDADWQTAFTTPGITTAPLRFKAYEDGTFTLRWGTANADFSYLHLIDNITGMDIDCLTTDSYAFEGRTTDYTSRFKLVFECTGVEEDGPSTGSGSFAFQMGDEMVVNGEGLLQVFDVNGRCLMSETLHGQQNTVGLPGVSAGVYVIRLTNNNQVRTQKIVVR